MKNYPQKRRSQKRCVVLWVIPVMSFVCRNIHVHATAFATCERNVQFCVFFCCRWLVVWFKSCRPTRTEIKFCFATLLMFIDQEMHFVSLCASSTHQLVGLFWPVHCAKFRLISASSKKNKTPMVNITGIENHNYRGVHTQKISSLCRGKFADPSGGGARIASDSQGEN